MKIKKSFVYRLWALVTLVSAIRFLIEGVAADDGSWAALLWYAASGLAVSSFLTNVAKYALSAIQEAAIKLNGERAKAQR